ALRASIFHMMRRPAGPGDKDAYEYLSDGVLILNGPRVERAVPYAELTAEERRALIFEDLSGCLLTPGFVDAHVHFPQIGMIGAYGAQLMEWLERYTFPAEQAFADPDFAREAAAFFLKELLRNGTTSAMVFATVHEVSADALFEDALKRGMRLIAGKVLMDRGGPESLLDGPDLGREATERLIGRWRGKGRLGYALTPRFALSCSDAQLAMAGELFSRYPDVYLQTHVSENTGEIAAVAELFPDDVDYLGVYERHGLVGARSVLAHGVHLDDGAFKRLSASRATIAHCPSSNFFLGSGLFPLAEADALGAPLALGSDVGAGTSLSAFRTMAEAYQTAQLRGRALDPLRAYYLATLGGAEALGLGAHIGNFEPGKEADFIALDLAATPLLKRRMDTAHEIEDILFSLAILGDDRAVARTYVAGALAHNRDARDAPDA
ncbi:MAG: guanine deaminase, partial [Pseudomonadota bacterium]